MFYNESWAKELGFSGPPKTPAEFRAQSCAAAIKNNTSKVVDKYGTGGWIIDNDALTTLSWMSAFGAQPVPGDAGKAYTFETKEGEAAWTFLRGMLNDGCAWLSRDPSPHDYFAKRMALFYSGTLLDLQHQQHWLEKAGNEDKWRILPFMGKDGKPVLYSSGFSYALLEAKPEEQMAAWVFLRWMEKPEVAVRFVKALPSLPVSSAQAAQLADVKSQSPWNMILPLAEAARPAPTLESWPAARRLFEDATWQLYHSLPEEVPQILPYLDEALRELGSAP
jgi:multiple sugar transport system substrate-binding protein/sn-glycerol 3-phosphate transport system substrate-binding protein